MQAYDLTLLPYPIRENTPRQQGWCFGLPSGITPEQWPLDPNNGFPLNHGFTLLLPTDYRIYGPEIVALSFFAVAPEQNDGGTPCRKKFFTKEIRKCHRTFLSMLSAFITGLLFAFLVWQHNQLDWPPESPDNQYHLFK
ncbi:hypothetical protein [Escherichia albertii]|uniref:hypothetical protein n=1 Tax=Escherichia albertii TaxID=208962 RepID=UPI001FCA3EC1|nr:hypothetical protein [Escherichia albertii]